MTAVWTIYESPWPKANLPELRFATDEELEDVEALAELVRQAFVEEFGEAALDDLNTRGGERQLTTE